MSLLFQIALVALALWIAWRRLKVPVPAGTGSSVVSTIYVVANAGDEQGSPAPIETTLLASASDAALLAKANTVWLSGSGDRGTCVPIVRGLLNFFGQRPSTSAAATAAASLEVYAPKHVRGGLYFEARF